MSVRTCRCLLFLALALTVPLPLWIGFDALVPPARYLLLAAATGAIAAVEGAQDPVTAILALFAVHAVAYLLAAWGIAWAAARALRQLSPERRGMAVLGVCALLLGFALLAEPYVTPFGRAATANLLGALS